MDGSSVGTNAGSTSSNSSNSSNSGVSGTGVYEQAAKSMARVQATLSRYVATRVAKQRSYHEYTRPQSEATNKLRAFLNHDLAEKTAKICALQMMCFYKVSSAERLKIYLSHVKQQLQCYEEQEKIETLEADQPQGPQQSEAPAEPRKRKPRTTLTLEERAERRRQRRRERKAELASERKAQASTPDSSSLSNQLAADLDTFSDTAAKNALPDTSAKRSRRGHAKETLSQAINEKENEKATVSGSRKRGPPRGTSPACKRAKVSSSPVPLALQLQNTTDGPLSSNIQGSVLKVPQDAKNKDEQEDIVPMQGLSAVQNQNQQPETNEVLATQKGQLKQRKQQRQNPKTTPKNCALSSCLLAGDTQETQNSTDSISTSDSVVPRKRTRQNSRGAGKSPCSTANESLALKSRATSSPLCMTSNSSLQYENEADSPSAFATTFGSTSSRTMLPSIPMAKTNLNAPLLANIRFDENGVPIKNHEFKTLKTQLNKVWRLIALNHVPRVARSVAANYAVKLNNHRRLCKVTQRVAARKLRPPSMRTGAVSASALANTVPAPPPVPARRLMRECMAYWKLNEKAERADARRAQQAAVEQQRILEEEREQQRQERKLHFLLSQTELFCQFVSSKLDRPSDAPISRHESIQDVSFDQITEPEETQDATPLFNREKLKAAFPNLEIPETGIFYSPSSSKPDTELTPKSTLNSPIAEATVCRKQPSMLACELKEYQLRGLQWLASLYDHGINGILADEMGLGKTVQAIALLAWLAEERGVWGPHLVVTPASTLHNWLSEIQRFAPRLRAVPYWGQPSERQVLRQYWSRRHVVTANAPCHIVVTSYQYALSDLKYLMPTTWGYLVLDEAQAIKSSSSLRWNALLKIKSRCRLLLTGTPVQNTIKELWSLLHFIMPALFDSHQEFTAWFARDIESAAASGRRTSAFTERQIKRLHQILQPFILRRVKSEVQSELGEKLEYIVSCRLTPRQQRQYTALKQSILNPDFYLNSNIGDENEELGAAIDGDPEMYHEGTDFDIPFADHHGGFALNQNRLMNLVMQFRKICNHPDLLEETGITTPALFKDVVTRQRNSQLVSYTTPSSAANATAAAMAASSTAAGHAALGNSIYTCSPDWSMLKIAPYSRSLLGLVADVSLVSAPNLDRLSHGKKISGQILINKHISLCNLSPASVLQLRFMNTIQRHNLLYAGDHSNCQKKNSLWNSQPLSFDEAINRILSMRMMSRFHKQVWNTFNVPYSVSQIYFPNVIAPPGISFVSSITSVSESFSKISKRSFISWPKTEHERANLLLKLNNFSLPYQAEVDANNIRTFAPNWMPGIPRMAIQRCISSSVRCESLSARLLHTSGKLRALDLLLSHLKAGKHKCLIYFQMTRMMDIMETYLRFRRYSYLRLDGSTGLGDRRDLVSDWQTRDDLFVFILSTRAGGVGINLTAADTVIFFDSDWNPTVDRQAMDRAHRLGQTRQVTVYRLCTKDTVEERILERARTKDDMQRMVIVGRKGKSVAENAGQPSNLTTAMQTKLMSIEAAGPPGLDLVPLNTGQLAADPSHLEKDASSAQTSFTTTSKSKRSNGKDDNPDVMSNADLASLLFEDGEVPVPRVSSSKAIKDGRRKNKLKTQ